jgi:hypothetical protein
MLSEMGIMSRIDKMFALGNSLSTTADTSPPEGIVKSELKYHKSTVSYVCCICNGKVKSGIYHIHKSLVKQATNHKRSHMQRQGLGKE